MYGGGRLQTRRRRMAIVHSGNARAQPVLPCCSVNCALSRRIVFGDVHEEILTLGT